MDPTTRRGFLGECLRYGAALPSLGLALDLVCDFHRRALAAPPEEPVEASYYDRLPGRRIQCHLCPLDCTLDDGQTCFCRTRTNRGGRLVNDAHGNPCILRADPIEKLPLHHFMPGTQTLSIATAGCNLRCLYCQNWEQSQSRPRDVRSLDLPVARGVESARSEQCGALAFTYTEPVVYYDYVRDLAAAAHEQGLRNVVATAAYIQREPLRALCRVVDAFSVALKGFTEEYYERVCGARLQPVLDSLDTIREAGVWLEIVTLIVPTLNDSTGEVAALARHVRANLGADVPLHLGRFVPEYRLRELPRTPVATLEEARAAALAEGLRHVYIFNVAPHEANSTRCLGCGAPLVERVGFRVTANHLRPGGTCPGCGDVLPGVFAD